ncbi:MAG: hypothetical protein WAV46_00855 [Candidatus Moraniibacteriota bacterium]
MAPFLPAGFRVTIFIHLNIKTVNHPPEPCASQCERQVFFRDIINATTSKEARNRAIAQFWEDICSCAVPGIDTISELVRCQTDLPKYFYVDTQPIYKHHLERGWKEEFSLMETRYKRRWDIIKEKLIPRRTTSSKK